MCGRKDIGMLNSPGSLPSSCRACGSLGSPCGPCQTENATSWVINGSGLGTEVKRGIGGFNTALTSLGILRTRRGTEDHGLLSGDL